MSGTAMLAGVTIVVAAAGCAVVASYVMWHAAGRSGLWSLIAGAALVIVSFVLAVVIGLIMTRAWLG